MAATRPTVKDALAEIGAHERECAIRYENIEKRLDSGLRFDRSEQPNLRLYVHSF